MTEMNEQTVRAEVRAWLEANWDTDLGLVEWRNKLVDSGLGSAALAEHLVWSRFAGWIGTRCG